MFLQTQKLISLATASMEVAYADTLQPCANYVSGRNSKKLLDASLESITTSTWLWMLTGSLTFSKVKIPI